MKKVPAVAAALFFGTVLLFFFSTRLFFFGGQSYEFCHYAEISTNILNGKGFTTKTFAPSELALYEAHNIHISDHGPVTWRFRGYAYWCAFWMNFSRSDFGMALANGMAHALWVSAVFLVGRRFFSFNTALIASALWAINPSMLAGYDLFGHPDVLFGFLFMVFHCVWWFHVPKMKPASWGFFAMGLFGSVLLLCRNNFVLFLPFYIGHLIVLHKKKSPVPIFLFLCGAGASLLHQRAPLPSQLSAWSLSSSTFASDMPWNEYRIFSTSSLLTREAALPLLKKAAANLGLALKAMPFYWGLISLFPFFIANLATNKSRENRFFMILFVLFLYQTVFFSFLRFETLGFLNGRYYLWFGPFVVLYAVSFLIDQKGPARKTVALLVAGFLIVHWGDLYKRIPRQIDHPSHQPISTWPEFLFLKENLPENAWILTNCPTQITWYTGRTTVNIPVHLSDVEKMQKEWPIDYVFLLHHRIGEMENFPEWDQMLSGQTKMTAKGFFTARGFELEKVFPAGLLYKKAKT